MSEPADLPIAMTKRAKRDPSGTISSKVEWLLSQKSKAYKNVFDNSDGRVVLRDLYELIRPDLSTPLGGGDGSLAALKLAQSDGRREVWEHLMKRLRLNPRSIQEYAQRFAEEDEGESW